MEKSLYNSLYEILQKHKLTKINDISKKIVGFKEEDYKELKEDWMETYKNHKKVDLYQANKDYLTYFPSNRFQEKIDYNILNKLLLYADKIVLNDPLTSLFIIAPNEYAAGLTLKENIPKFLMYYPLFKSQIGELIPQRLFVQYSSNSFIGQQISEDVTDPNFHDLIENNIVLTKDSNSYRYSIVDEEVIGMTQEIKFQPGGSGSVSIPTKVDDELEIIKKENEKDQKFIDGIINRKAMELNYDLLESNSYNANYITNSPLVNGLLNVKSKRNKSIYDTADMKFLPSILSLSLPNFEKVETNNIIKIRKRYFDEFSNFRKDIKESFNEINSLPFSSEFQKDVDKISRENIIPKIELMKREMKIIKKHRFGRILGNAAMTALPLIGSVTINDPYQIIAWAVSCGFGKKTFDEMLDLWKERQEIKRGSLYFLYKVLS